MDRREQIYWVLRSQAGNRSALDSLLKSIQGPLYGYIRKMLGEDTLAEDVLQDVMIIVCRKIKTLRTPEFFQAWVYRIASRQVFKASKHARRWRDRFGNESATVDCDRVASPIKELDSLEVNELFASLDRLSPPIRSVLVLHYQQGITLNEVSAILGIALGTVKSRLSFGLSILRKEWKSGNPNQEK
ncbi:MAG: sigma-70 family RNA polymerase sigma factor [Planctomycetes bacterium]|nr:sigma-70 family RNA polymerase sigma factor [Planctomycetota bacterium]